MLLFILSYSWNNSRYYNKVSHMKLGEKPFRGSVIVKRGLTETQNMAYV